MFKIFGHKESKETIPYNPETQIPVLKCSICTGEKVAGFKDKATGKFTDIALIKDNRDLDSFMERYNISEISKEY